MQQPDKQDHRPQTLNDTIFYQVVVALLGNTGNPLESSMGRPRWRRVKAQISKPALLLSFSFPYTVASFPSKRGVPNQRPVVALRLC